MSACREFAGAYIPLVLKILLFKFEAPRSYELAPLLHKAVLYACTLYSRYNMFKMRTENNVQCLGRIDRHIPSSNIRFNLCFSKKFWRNKFVWTWTRCYMASILYGVIYFVYLWLRSHIQNEKLQRSIS